MREELDGLRARLEAEGVPRVPDDLLEVALTHPSWSAENPGHENYERLEFLGDAVLSLATSEMLYRTFGHAREGRLSRLRIELVNATSLAKASRALALPAFARLGVGEERADGRQRDGLAADLFEAVIGAIFIAHGYHPAAEFARACVRSHLPNDSQDLVTLHDSKGRLQRWTQAVMSGFPRYVIVNDSERAETEPFEARVTLPDGRTATGQGRRKKDAEQQAARSALRQYAPAEHVPECEEESARPSFRANAPARATSNEA
jgi:ribonuclease-3